VLAPELELDPRARILDREPAGAPLTCIYTTESSASGKGARFKDRAELVPVPYGRGSLDLDRVLADLMRRGVRSVLVEGGGRTHASFLTAGLGDRAALFLARRLIGARGGTPLVDAQSVARPAAGWRLEQTRQLALGSDLLLLGTLVPGASESGEERCSPD
jgi:diaminohydroxyphosphoribosylaminopyrimidine deaminase/5-amino-6-(5-phosphoribosylamino)uracil reductase